MTGQRVSPKVEARIRQLRLPRDEAKEVRLAAAVNPAATLELIQEYTPDTWVPAWGAIYSALRAIRTGEE